MILFQLTSPHLQCKQQLSRLLINDYRKKPRKSTLIKMIPDVVSVVTKAAKYYFHHAEERGGLCFREHFWNSIHFRNLLSLACKCITGQRIFHWAPSEQSYLPGCMMRETKGLHSLMSMRSTTLASHNIPGQSGQSDGLCKVSCRLPLPHPH